MSELNKKNLHHACSLSCARAHVPNLPKNDTAWCPIGPCIVNPASLENPDSLELRTTLNGKVVQRGNTSQLLLSIVSFSRTSLLNRA